MVVHCAEMCIGMYLACIWHVFGMYLASLGSFSLISIIREAEAVAQLVERLLLTPEIRGLNPDSGKFYLPNCFERRK